MEHPMTSISAEVSLRPAHAPARDEIRRADRLSVRARQTASTSPARPAPPVVPGDPLPRAKHILAVTSRPGQESADLGGLLYAFRRRGASLALLCLTRGEASPLNSTYSRLETIRPWELQVAAGLLGISSVAVADYPDGQLARYPLAELTERVRRAAREHPPDLMLVIDPAGGDPDDAAAAQATCSAAGQISVLAAARKLRAFGGWQVDLGADAAAARAIQRSAMAAHVSQSGGLSQALRRLDTQGSRRQLRWLAQGQVGSDGPAQCDRAGSASRARAIRP
jgi:LmbE family N-acetylglucosaminyl deacetylase